MDNLSASNSCVNCTNFSKDSKCEIHSVLVNEKYTCNDFDLLVTITE